MTRMQSIVERLEEASRLIAEAEILAGSERLPLGVGRNIERAREGAREAAMLMRHLAGAFER